MSTTMVTNGKPRKQLSDQLDRLDEQLARHDSILDGLSEGLNGAVVDAAREGTKLAVKEAVIELLTNPELRDVLHQASTPPAESRPSFWSRVKDKVRSTVAHVKSAVASAASAVSNRVAGASTAVAKTVAKARQSRQVQTAIKIVVGAGALLAVTRYVALRGVGAVVESIKSVAIAGINRIQGWVRTAVMRLKFA